eukprot:3727867-Alexandrium_andersonii.AAC.1
MGPKAALGPARYVRRRCQAVSSSFKQLQASSNRQPHNVSSNCARNFNQLHAISNRFDPLRA